MIVMSPMVRVGKILGGDVMSGMELVPIKSAEAKGAIDRRVPETVMAGAPAVRV